MNLVTNGFGGGADKNNLPIWGFSGEESEVVVGIAKFSFKDRYLNNEFINPSLGISFKDKHIPSFEMAEIIKSFKDKHIIEFEAGEINSSFKAKAVKTQEARDISDSFKDRHIKTAEDKQITKSSAIDIVQHLHKLNRVMGYELLRRKQRGITKTPSHTLDPFHCGSCWW